MITSKFLNQAKFLILITAAVILLLPTADVSAARPADLDCDPLPVDDIDLLNQCVFWSVVEPEVSTDTETGSPQQPISGTGILGTYGVGGAYNSQDNIYLVVGSDLQGSVSRLFGVIIDGNTNQILVPKFRIDQSTISANYAEAVYNPQTNQWLVVWEDQRVSNNLQDVYGRIINADGSFAGPDFKIANNVFLDDLDYDATRNQYLVLTDNSNVHLTVLDTSGNIVKEDDLGPQTGEYTGEASLAINTNLDQYWVSYLDQKPLAQPCSRCEDNQIMLVKINPTTLQETEPPTLINTPKPGQLIGQTTIAYDPITGGALIGWVDYSVSGVMGKLVYDSGTTGSEKQLLTPQTQPSSDLFDNATLSYNAATGLFYLSANDNSGGVMLLEISADAVINTYQPIGSTNGSATYWGDHIDTNTGSIVIGSAGQQTVVIGTSVNPPFTPPGTATNFPPVTPGVGISPTKLGEMISQIYIYALGVAGALALLMMIIGGYLVMFSAGNAATATRGKEFVYSAIIGIVILLASYLILSTINPDLTNFQLNSLQQLDK